MITQIKHIAVVVVKAICYLAGFRTAAIKLTHYDTINEISNFETQVAAQILFYGSDARKKIEAELEELRSVEFTNEKGKIQWEGVVVKIQEARERMIKIRNIIQGELMRAEALNDLNQKQRSIPSGG